jgi:hypothetical protein
MYCGMARGSRTVKLDAWPLHHILMLGELPHHLLYSLSRTMRLSAETFAAHLSSPSAWSRRRLRRVKCKLPIDLLSTFRVCLRGSETSHRERIRVGSRCLLPRHIMQREISEASLTRLSDCVDEIDRKSVEKFCSALHYSVEYSKNSVWINLKKICHF